MQSRTRTALAIVAGAVVAAIGSHSSVLFFPALHAVIHRLSDPASDDRRGCSAV